MSLRPFAALLLVASLAGSCSSGGPDEIVLVSRVWEDYEECDIDSPCRNEGPGQTFRDADGGVATVGATVIAWHLENLSESQAECGGDMIPRRTYIYRAEPASDETSRQKLIFDDGSAVQLFVESFVEVVDKCSETVGRWEVSLWICQVVYAAFLASARSASWLLVR